MRKRFALPLLLLVLGMQQVSQAQTNEDEATRLNNQAIDLEKTTPKAPEVLSLLQRAIQLSPNDEVLRSNYVMALFQRGLHQEALVAVNEARRLFPNTSELWSERIMVLSSLGLSAEAEFEGLKQYAVEGGLDANGKAHYATKPIIAEYGYPISQEKATPAPGEIRLDGLVKVIAPGRLTISSMLFVLPNKRFHLFDAPKSKTTLVAGVEAEYENLGSIPLNQLRSGDFVAVIGKDTPKGFVAARIICSPRTAAEEKERGSPFEVASVPLQESSDDTSIDYGATGEATFQVKNGAKDETLLCLAAVIARDGQQTALLSTLSSFVAYDAENDGPKDDTDDLHLNRQSLTGTTEIKGLGHYGPHAVLPASLPMHPALHAFVGGDVIAVAVKDAKSALPLAPKLPSRGELVHLAGWYDGALVWVDSNVAYADSNRLILHASDGGEEDNLPGSIIINDKGEIIGLQAQGNRDYIAAISVDALRRAMKNTAPPP